MAAAASDGLAGAGSGDQNRPEPDAATTTGTDYTARLERLGGARWKQLIDVQRPYRWNLQRLRLGRVLDVGCGIGRNLAALPDGVGVDHNATSIEAARAAGYTAWTTQEWPDSPDAVPASFDAMLLAHVLEHMDGADADEVLRSYLPYLKPRAALVLICPQEKGYATDDTHVRFVGLHRMAQHAVELGFVPARMYSFPFPRAAGTLFPYNEFVVVALRSGPGS